VTLIGKRFVMWSMLFFFSSRRRHTRFSRDWSSDVCSSDLLGNTVTSFSGTVTVTLAANPGGGTLAGHPTVTAVNGVATFADLSIDRVSTGYMLQATGAGLTTASVPFDVTPGAATQLAFTVQPTNT